MRPKMYSVEEACEILCVSQSYFYQLVKARQILVFKRGSRTLVTSYAIDDYVTLAYENGVTGEEFNGTEF